MLQKKPKNIYCVKTEGAVTRWFKKFCLDCKNLDDQSEAQVSLKQLIPRPYFNTQRQILRAELKGYQVSIAAH